MFVLLILATDHFLEQTISAHCIIMVTIFFFFPSYNFSFFVDLSVCLLCQLLRIVMTVDIWYLLLVGWLTLINSIT